MTLTATATGSGDWIWPAASIVFVLETTPYDGVYDPAAGEPGSDVCAASGSGQTLCEESNADPFFAAGAGQIAEAIAAAHPGTALTFGLVDYFATHDRWDDVDGYAYHVDVGTPVAASSFGSDVNSTFVRGVLGGSSVLLGSDLKDNILTSPSITALYGVLSGAGIAWPADAHRVVVWVGSTAPRDPGYLENYCASPSAYVPTGTECTRAIAQNFTSSGCEPSFTFPTGGLTSPTCEGWVLSHDGTPADSLASLARGGAACAGSPGGNCTVDTIDLLDGMTDPSSSAWPSVIGGGPEGGLVLNDTSAIIDAGCDLATATGGSWSGPGFADCAGQAGTLQYVARGPASLPDLSNPTLFTALVNVSLGTPPSPIAVVGTSDPMFTFVSFGTVAFDPDLAPAASCSTPEGPWSKCQAAPTFGFHGSREILQWNWSTDANSNVLAPGDIWSARLRVMATGPPYDVPMPVDACTLTQCLLVGGGASDGAVTSAVYRPAGLLSSVDLSFPVATVTVLPDSKSGLSSPPPPPPVIGPPPPVASPGPVGAPVLPPAQLPGTAGIAGLSLPAAAAGLLAAGFARIWLRSRHVRVPIAVKAPSPGSRFDARSHEESDRQAKYA